MTTLQAPATHRRMTADEIATYERDGFVEIREFFPLAELASLNAEIDRIRQRRDEQAGHGANIILQLGLRSEVTRRMCADERILDLIEAVVKPGIAIYSAKMVEKLPFDTAICHWHQDDAYYRQHSECACRMSVWIPLQDCDEENGCVWMVPGSHRHGLQPATNLEPVAPGRAHCTLGFAHGRESVEGAIPVRARAGSIVLFHALTWHRSLENRTNQHRRAFIVSYQDAVTDRGNGEQHRILRVA